MKTREELMADNKVLADRITQLEAVLSRTFHSLANAVETIETIIYEVSNEDLAKAASKRVDAIYKRLRDRGDRR